jgi:multicomponent Na+:H+ antiporter subunit D
VIAGLILIPLGAATLALLLRRWTAVVGLIATSLSPALAVLIAFTVWRQGPIDHLLGGWGPPLGISLRADGLTAVMLLMTSFTTLPVAAYATAYFSDVGEEGSPGASFWPLMLLLIGSLNALFLSADIFNLYVTLELMTIAAVGLVVLRGDATAMLAAARYLLAAFVASMFFLLGVAILYAGYGTLDLLLLEERIVAEPASFVAMALVTAGLLLKTALFPLHFWLPRAHAAAPAPVSALLSSLVVTGTFYLVVRLWTAAFAVLIVPPVGQLIGWLGAAAIVWGSVQALRQQHLKVMIAYSTVAQLGYLFLQVPLVTAAMATPEGADLWGRDAWNGSVYYAISHALAKAAMFLAAGSIVHALGSDRIVGISGIARHLPVTTYAFGIAAMTLIGLPPSGGFVAKWLLITASLTSGQWWWAVVMLVGGMLTAGYVFLVLGQELSLARSDREVTLEPVPRTMEYAALTLAIAALILGIRVSEPLVLLRIGNPFGGG